MLHACLEISFEKQYRLIIFCLEIVYIKVTIIAARLFFQKEIMFEL